MHIRATKLLVIFALLFFASFASAQGTVSHIRWGASLPAACSPSTGDVFFRTSGAVGLHFCSATNTWQPPSATILTTKGDLFTFSTTPTRLAVGADGLCLKADSTQTTGLNWQSCTTGGGGTVTSFAAPSGSWPAWLVPTVTNSTSTPSLAVAATTQGNGSKVQLSTGSTTTNDCTKYDVNGNTVDAGAGCVTVGNRPFNPVITLGTAQSSSQTVFAYTIPASPSGLSVSIPANCSGSSWYDIATATGSTTFTLKKNGTTFCTGTVSASGSTLSWSTGGSTTTLASGDVITVVYSGDSTLTGGLTIVGTY